MRAMVLAAGLGTRLRPLTETVPKPLLPVANRPILEYTFALLAGGGIEEAVVNTHHLADTMEEALRRIALSGLTIHLSRERRILGTAGGPKKASSLLSGGPFVMVNGDFLIDVDLREVAAFHLDRGAKASMVLREHPGGGIFTDPEGRIRQFLEPGRKADPGWTECGFTGIHVLDPEVFRLIPSRTPWEINRQVYPEMLRRGWPVFGFLHRGYWREAGDPPGLLAANLEVLSGRAGSLRPLPGAGRLLEAGPGCAPPVLAGEEALIDAGARLGPEVVVGPQACIGAGAELRRAVVLEGCDVGEAERVEDAVVASGARGNIVLRP